MELQGEVLVRMITGSIGVRISIIDENKLQYQFCGTGDDKIYEAFIDNFFDAKEGAFKKGFADYRGPVYFLDQFVKENA